MRLTGPGRVVAVVAATLSGAALTALLVVPGVRGVTPTMSGAGDGSSAGLVTGAVGEPSAAATTAGAPRSSTGPDAAPPSPSGPVVGTTPAEPGSGGDTVAQAAPTRLLVPRLGIDMSVEPEGVDGNGQMALPSDPRVAGWYQWGGAPQDVAGATVLAAHVDSRTLGVGPFVRLGSARPGDEVQVVAGTQRLTYRVSQVAAVDKARLDGDGLFALTGAPRLHLVTCTGAYVKGSGYTQNLVVVADLVGAGSAGQDGHG